MSKEENETSLQVASYTLGTMVTGYYFWFIVYVLLGIMSVALPGAAALLHDPEQARISAGLGAISAAVFAFLRPNELASAYDAAATVAWKAKVRARLGQLTREEAATILNEAIDRAGLKYGGLPSK